MIQASQRKMNDQAHAEKTLLIAVLILIPTAFFLRLNSYQLLFEEPRRALVALEMLIAGDWLVPTTNGTLYYNKPPLYNWVLIAFLKTFGFSEWVVRLPSILSLFATGILHYHFSKKYIGHQAAMLSALFYVTSADILFFFSLLGEIDLFYALIVYLQGMLIFHFYQKKQIGWLFISSYLLTSAGLLTKGIPSLFFQAITLLVIFILNKDYRRLYTIWHFAGIFVLVITAGGYFYLYSREQDVERYLARLFTETFSRTGMEKSGRESMMHLINFPVMLIKIAAPWFLLFWITLRPGWKNHLRSSAFLRYCLWFCIANGVLYFLSPGTRERYLYMFLPFVFSVLGFAVLKTAGNKESSEHWIRKFFRFIGIAITLGTMGIGVYGFTLGNYLPAALCLILGAGLSIWLFRYRLPTTMAFLLGSVILMLAGRIAFDLVILPTKKQYVTYRSDALNMARIVKEEPVYLFGEPERKVDDVKFAGVHFAQYERNEPTYLTFQTSYYFSAFSGRIIKYTDKGDLKGYYISRESAVAGLRKRTYYRFNNKQGKEDDWYILYKRL